MKKGYRIIRVYEDQNHPNHLKVIKNGLTLAEAQKHCKCIRTSKKGQWVNGCIDWLDGYINIETVKSIMRLRA